jgi:hypothetical protein
MHQSLFMVVYWEGEGWSWIACRHSTIILSFENIARFNNSAIYTSIYNNIYIYIEILYYCTYVCMHSHIQAVLTTLHTSNLDEIA